MLLATITSAPSHAQSHLEAQYEATLAGITIGTGQWIIDISDTQYAATATGKTSSLLRLISNGHGSSTASGTLAGGRLLSSSYIGTIVNGQKRSDVRLTIENGDVKEFKLNPPQDHNPERVPISETHRRHVLDPMSAAILPAHGNNGPLSSDACKRRLSVFDGWLRYNLQFDFKRMDHMKAEKGYAGPVVVCAVYFSPVAGYVPSRTAIKYIANLRDMEVWLAPVMDTHVLVPIRAEMPTPFGHAVLKATQFVSAATAIRASSNRH